MANVQIGARFNESKHQFEVHVLPQDTPIPALAGTRMGLILKQVEDATFNQEQFFGLYGKAIDYVRDNNILNQIAAGDFGSNNHLLVSLERSGNVSVQPVTGNVAGACPDDSISLAVPVQSGWAKESSTVYLDNTAKRLHEKFLEDFAKKV